MQDSFTSAHSTDRPQLPPSLPQTTLHCVPDELPLYANFIDRDTVNVDNGSVPKVDTQNLSKCHSQTEKLPKLAALFDIQANCT